MTDEETRALAALRDHVKRERADDAALEAIASGDDAGEAAADLARRAKEGDAEAVALLEASRPLGDDVVAKIAVNVAPNASAPKTIAPKASPPKPATVSFLRRAATYAGPLALAAGIAFLVTRGPSGGGPELPAYALAATGEQAMRGDPTLASSTRIHAGAPTSKFEIVARPEVAATSRVAAWAFVIGANTEVEPTPLDAQIDVAPEGGVRIRGTGRALEGAREIRVIIAPAETITKFDEALARAKHGKSDTHVRVLVVAIDP